MDEKRLDILEHRVNKLDDELGETKILLAKTETLTQQSIETIKQLADYFGVSTDYLLGKTDIRNSNNITNSSDKLLLIPVVGKIAAGQPILAEEYIGDIYQ